MTAQDINTLFRKLGLTLGSVESFTGGLFASSIVETPGASHFFKGGLVTYATEEKNRLLGIPYPIIDRYGVVSKEIAAEMAERARKILNVDYCVSFTGNAGPEAMEGKPVGEVHIGFANKESTKVLSLNLSGSRDNIRKEAISQAYKVLTNLLK